MAVATYEIGAELCAALSLPKGTRKFTLSAEEGGLVTVECEYCPDITDEFTALLARFHLAPIAAEPAETPDVPHDFDAWMRDRTNAAHAAYMERHAGGGIDYQRAPAHHHAWEENDIVRFFNIPDCLVRTRNV